MIDFKTKTTTVATIELQEKQDFSMNMTSLVLYDIAELAQYGDIVSPSTGQVFTSYQIDDMIDLLQTLRHYSRNQIEIEMHDEEEDE